MKKLYFSVVLLFIMIACGCESQRGWYDQTNNRFVTEDQYQTMTPEEKESFEAVIVKQFKPETIAKGDQVAEIATATIQVVRPWIPEPFATGAVAVIAGLVSLWQLISRRKTYTLLERIKLGAQITAESVDTIVKPSVEMWNAFKARQTAESSHTDAIMPDKVKDVA